MKYTRFSLNCLVKCMTIIVTLGIADFSFAKTNTLEQNKINRKLVASYSNQKGINSGKKVEVTSTSERKWEFRTAPIAQIVSWFTLDVSYRLFDQWASGPSVILYNANAPGGMFGPSYKGSAIGWNGNYYFNSVYKSTWYISAHAYYESYKSYPHAYLGYKDFNGFKANSAIGYQWRWSRVNLMTGIGTEFRNYNVTDKKDAINGVEQSPIESKDSFWLPHIEFKVGIEI